MKIDDTHDYAATADAVMAMFTDEVAIRERYEGMGHRDVQILGVERDDTSARIRTSRVVDVDLPGFAAKVLKPTNTMAQTDEWRNRGDGTWDGTFHVEVQGAPVRIGGNMKLEPNAQGCTHQVHIEVDVKVPLVGGKIADWVGKNDVARTLREEFAAGDRWLAAD